MRRGPPRSALCPGAALVRAEDDIVAVAAVDADRGGDRPRVGAGARAAERDGGAAGGGETGGCADVELALVHDAVAAFSARDTGGLGRRGGGAAGAGGAVGAERRLVHDQAGAGAGGDAALVMDEVMVVTAVDAGCGADRPRVGAGARGAEPDAGAAGGDETGGCADPELAFVRDAVAAFSACDASGP